MLPTKLVYLQNLAKRDAESYEEEVMLQWQHYQSTRDIFLFSQLTNGIDEFMELLEFIAQLSNLYPKIKEEYPGDLFRMLKADFMDAALRIKVLQCLVLLQKRGVITSMQLMEGIFPQLLSTKSKSLRVHLYKLIISDLKNSNLHAKNQMLNRTIQTLLHSFVEDTASKSAFWSVRICQTLWKKSIWTDARTVDIMRIAAFHEDPRVVLGAANFFLGKEDEAGEGDSDASDDDKSDGGAKSHMDIRKVKKQIKNSGKSNKAERRLNRVRSTLKRRERAASEKHMHLNFSAIHQLHDPQRFAEELFERHLYRKSTLKMEQKAVVLNLVSRVVGSHKLQLEGLYSWLIKYLTPAQLDVTQFMVAAVQATHEMVVPDVLYPVIRALANEFVTGGVGNEVVQAGLNTIREICARQPSVMDATLLQDLTEYQRSKDRGIAQSARGLISLFRVVAPDLLHRKDRGHAELAAEPVVLRFGEERGVKKGIEGLELLQKWKEENQANEPLSDDEENDRKAWAEWEVEDDSDDSEGDWINVSSDEEHVLDISDSDDDKSKSVPPADPARNIATEKVRVFLFLLCWCSNSQILTPADLAKLQELKAKAVVDKFTSRSKRRLEPERTNDSEIVTSDQILGIRKKTKDDRVADRVVAKKQEKDKHLGRTAQFKARSGHGSTNKDKERNKPWMMVQNKRSIQSRAGRSLVTKQKNLRAAVDKLQKYK